MLNHNQSNNNGDINNGDINKSTTTSLYESWQRFRQFDWNTNEQWKNYFTNLTLPENISESKKKELILKYKKKFFQQQQEVLTEFQLKHTFVEIPVKEGSSHEATFIFLHGLGDQGNGWKQAFEILRRQYPELNGLKVILPNANTAKVTLNFGMSMPSWFDLYSLTLDDKEDVEGIRKASDAIQTFIEREIHEYGIPSEKILIGGFSQGGSLALYHGLTTKYKLAGIIALSTFISSRQEMAKLKEFVNKKTPIFQAHGTSDQVVQYKWGLASKQYIETLLDGDKSNYVFKSYNGMGHSSCMDEIIDVCEFIKKCIGK
ncbi:hypothetical protein ABK040_000815 [Willaertia magna]